MSLNQSRSDKSDYRKSGGSRSGGSGQQRTASGVSGKGGSGGNTAPPLASHSSSVSANRSFKKTNNAQGGHPRATVGSVNSLEFNTTTASHAVENGTLVQASLHEASDAPALAAASKQADTSSQKSNCPIPRAPSSQTSTMTSDSSLPATPAKAPGDTGKGFSLQFGSISPGFMNGMQIPARTSSAPPNLDEQKRDQARHDSLRAVPAVPIPSAPKPQLPKKDIAPVGQTTVESGTDSKPKKHNQVAPTPPQMQSQKPSVLPTAGISMPMHFHQPPVSMQFGGPSPQIPSQSMQGTSLQMPIQVPLHMGNASQLPQQVFVQALPHHLMQPQGVMHQSQSLGFNPQMGPQHPHQLGNLGMNMSPQFTQQPAGKFASTRRTVKITHPETHEELRLDKRADACKDGGSSGSRSHHSMPPQSQPLPSYTPTRPIGYYANSYSSGPPLFPLPNSLPMSSTQLTSSPQAPRFNYSVSQPPPNISFINPSAPNPFSMDKTHGIGELANLEQPRDAQGVISSTSASIPVTIKPATGSAGERGMESSITEKGDSPKLLRLPGSSHVRKDAEISLQNSSLQSKIGPGHSKGSPVSVAPVSPMPIGAFSIPVSAAGEPASVVSNIDARWSETSVESEFIKENQKEAGKKGQSQLPHQAGEESKSSLPPQVVSCNDSCKIDISVPLEAIVSHDPSRFSKDEAAESDVSATVVDDFLENAASNLSDIPRAGSVVGPAGKDVLPLDGRPLRETVEPGEHGEKEQELKQDSDSLKSAPPSNSLEAAETVEKTIQDTGTGVMEICHTNFRLYTHGEAQERHVDMSTSDRVLSTCADDSNSSISDASLARIDSMSCNEDVTKSNFSDGETATAPDSLLEANSTLEGEVTENSRPTSSSGSIYSRSTTSFEPHKMKNTVPKGKKKRKEILQKADAAGTTLDLYMAYKGPEEKKEIAVTMQTTEQTTNRDHKPVTDANHEDVIAKVKDEHRRMEVDDWEDAADISSPKLESPNINGHGGAAQNGEEMMAKKYSRDFLLTFSEQCTDLPEGFEITSDIADILTSPNVNASRVTDRECPSPGRIVDRQSGGPRVDRRGSGMMDADRWNKLPGAFPPGRDMGPDLSYGANMMGFRPGQGNNYGVLRNPRGQAPVQYSGGILSGPMQSLGSQGAIQRNNSDSDRWQRGTNFQRGLMPPPQTPLQVMHKADRKYEIGKVTDEEEAKQRRLKSILNKLTPQNFERLFEQVKEVNIDNAVTLTGVINQIFDKALIEPTFCEMYANFCYHLASELPDLSVDNEKITFKRLLLNKCQEEFERGEREEEEANKADGDGESKQSEEEREEKRLKARRRMLGNIRLIGELYKKRMLTERIMHDECINKLLCQFQNPDEENIEALCKLMSTIGEMIDHPKAKEHMDFYFDMMLKLSNNMKLSSRVRFMLKDVIDLRKNKWQQRRKIEGPKKIDEVHRDAAQERQAQANRLTRGPSMNPSGRRGQPLDFGPRASTTISSPVGQMGSYRPLPPQVRGYGAQDARMEERNAFENRTLSVPLLQRPLGDDSITLGPQGGLARGMSVRGQPSASTVPLPDVSSGRGDARRTGGLNGYSSASERAAYNSREELLSRYPPERLGGQPAYEQSCTPDLNSGNGRWDQRNPDRSYDRPSPVQSLQGQGVPSVQTMSLEKVWPEERLRDMSIAAIREFYSAKDEKEVVLCIKDLNAPSFYPSVISIWVTDCFERKDMERDMLAKLIVNLTKPRVAVFTPAQLIEGFESVLANLEDTVNDAPKAAEFLGRMFAKVILENVVSLREVGKLIFEGGEEPGRLREVGLAAYVLGSTLEMIKADGGESALNDIRARSNLRLEDFRPPDPIRSEKLEMFI
ncbi:hypothetical protein Ancab_037622 [Ancistrocladus abbreviatus]